MNNNQGNFIYNTQPQTPKDKNPNVIGEQSAMNTNTPLQNSTQQLNVLPEQENTNNINYPNVNNQTNNITPNFNNEFINTPNPSQQENIQITNKNVNNNSNINLNVIPKNFNNIDNNQINNVNNIYNSINQTNNLSVNQDNNRFEFNGVFSNQSSSIKDNISDEDYNMLNPQPDNKYINSNFDTTSTTLTDLNIDQNTPRIDYLNDPKVIANLDTGEKRKNTITITQETKVFLIIIAVLFLFIFVMPYIFDTLRNIG